MFYLTFLQIRNGVGDGHIAVVVVVFLQQYGGKTLRQLGCPEEN